MESIALAAFARQNGANLEEILRGTLEDFRRMSKREWSADPATHAKLVSQWRRLRDEPSPYVRIKSLQTLCSVADATREEILAMTDDDFFNLCVNVLGMTETQQARLVVDRITLREASDYRVPHSRVTLNGSSLDGASKFVISSTQARDNSVPENPKSFPEMNREVSSPIEQAPATKNVGATMSASPSNQVPSTAPVPENPKSLHSNAGDHAKLKRQTSSATKQPVAKRTKTVNVVTRKQSTASSPPQKHFETKVILLQSPGSPQSPSSRTRTDLKRKPVSPETNKPPASKRQKKAKASAGKGSVHENICRALVEWRALNVQEPLRTHVALLAGYPKPNSPGFTKALSKLKSKGIVEYPSSATVKLGDFGISSLPKGIPDVNIGPILDIKPPRDNAEIHEHIRTLLRKSSSPNKTSQIFEVLRNGRAHSRANVAAATGYEAKAPGFTKVLSTMSSLGLIQYPDKETVQLTAIAFPYGSDAHPSAVDPKDPLTASDIFTPSVDAKEDTDKGGIASESDKASNASARTPNKIKTRSNNNKKKKKPAKKRQASKKHTSSSDGKSVCSFLVCSFLMKLHALGITEVHRSDLAKATGYSNVNSAGFANTIKQLREEGIIECTKSTVQLTKHGISSLPSVDPPKDNIDMQDRLVNVLKTVCSSPKVEQIFDKLADGNAHKRDDLAASVGYTNVNSAGFTSVVTKMSSLGLIQKPKKGEIQFTDMVFPSGRNGPSRMASNPVAAAVVSESKSQNNISANVTSVTTSAAALSIQSKAVESKKPRKAKGKQNAATGSVRDRICNVLVELHALGIQEAPRLFVAESVGYENTKSTGFAKMLSALKKEDMVVCKKGAIRLTNTGIHTLSRAEPPKTNAEMQQRLLKVLKAVGSAPVKMEQIFTKLSDGKMHNRDVLADAVGYKNVKSTGFAKVLAKMKTLGLIEKPQKGHVQLSDRAFPFGRKNEAADDEDDA